MKLEPGVFCHWGKSCETCPKLSNIREPGVLSQKNLNPGLCHWRFANPGFCHTLTEPRVRTRGSVTRKLEPGVLSLEVCEPGVLEKPGVVSSRVLRGSAHGLGRYKTVTDRYTPTRPYPDFLSHPTNPTDPTVPTDPEPSRASPSVPERPRADAPQKRHVFADFTAKIGGFCSFV